MEGLPVTEVEVENPGGFVPCNDMICVCYTTQMAQAACAIKQERRETSAAEGVAVEGVSEVQEHDWINALWRKASGCDNSGSCVEVATVGKVVGVRDSKLGDASPVLKFDEPEWKAFTAGVIAGQF